MKNSAIYDSVSVEFSTFAKIDPSRLYVQFPWAMNQVKMPLTGLRVLDIGCGEGSLARMFARQGAVVFGYDNSIELIEQARAMDKKDRFGIHYIHADQSNVVKKIPPDSIDAAVSTCVLHYAQDMDQLTEFFSSTYKLLKPGKKFSALVSNPDFKRWGQLLYGRRYLRLPNNKLQVEFFDENEFKCAALYSDFKQPDYEHAASSAGWESFSWLPVRVTKEGRSKMGQFWDQYEQDCPYAGFRVVKPL